MEIQAFQPWLVITWCNTSVGSDAISLEKVTRVGERSVCHLQSRAHGLHSQSHASLGVERKVGGKLHLKLNICLRPIANKYYEGKGAKDIEKRVKSAWNCWNGNELDRFCLVRLAHGTGIHVRVCVVSCQDCQNQFTCEKKLRRSHSPPACGFTHLGIYKWTVFKCQVIEVTVHCCCSMLGVRFWLHGLVQPVLKHGPRSLTCVQVFGCKTCKRHERECLELFTCNRPWSWEWFEYEHEC